MSELYALKKKYIFAREKHKKQKPPGQGGFLHRSIVRQDIAFREAFINAILGIVIFVL